MANIGESLRYKASEKYARHCPGYKKHLRDTINYRQEKRTRACFIDYFNFSFYILNLDPGIVDCPK